MTEETWLVVRVFGGPVEAEMARAFLVEHDVRAVLRGPSSTTHSLTRFAGGAEVALLVPREDLEEARDALAALAPETRELPFRGAVPCERERSGEAERSSRAGGPRPRSVVAVLVAASVLPIAAAHLTQDCRGGEVVVRRRAAPDFALAPAEVEVPLPPAFADRPSLGPSSR